ncbi:MAG: porin family protein [Methylobacteriaceae bacterium]|nr:porin family protein [Methylobacteriaceae bacterium]
MLHKRLLLAVATTCCVGSAFAADLPSRAAPPPAPYTSPVPVSTWTGFYVGVNAGGTFSGSSLIALTPSTDFGPFPSGFASAQATGAYPTSLNSRRTGFIGGGQAGFNYQFGMFVAGFEADIQALPQRTSVSATLFNPAPPPANFAAPVFGTASVTRRLDYLGTARGRLGVAFGPALVYATGGLAYGRTDLAYTGTIGFPIAPTVFLTGSSSTSRTSLGYALGGGVEYAVWNNWSVKAEYLYYNLGRHSTIIGGSFTNFAPTTGGFSTASVRDDGHILRVGLNYRFGWGVPAPVVARY